jgi:hypothetical protein
MTEFNTQNPDYIKAYPNELTEDRLRGYIGYYFSLESAYRKAGLGRIYINTVLGFYKEAKKISLEPQTIHQIPGGAKVALGRFITGQPYTYKGWVLLDKSPAVEDPLNLRRQNIVLKDGQICKKITIDENTAVDKVESTVIMTTPQKMNYLISNWIVANDEQDAFNQLWQVNRNAVDLLNNGSCTS